MHILITGGAGFIGSNAAASFAKQGYSVTIYDNLSRKGADMNLSWLREQNNIEFIRGDVRNSTDIERAIAERQCDVVLHLAAQVAVTTSVVDPRTDLEINILGTFNVLEAIRKHHPNAILLNASTNKVYGSLKQFDTREEEKRYTLAEKPEGVDESTPLDFHSPYGCSKGAGDQYVIDYSRIYGIRTVNFRQSCIYGPRQFGIEDQGWVAWFLIATEMGRKLTVYGNGKQVRDILYVDDLIAAYQSGIKHIEIASGKSYNIGGGPTNAISLIELLETLESLRGKKVEFQYGDWRPGDQPVFIADIRLAEKELGWKPKISPREGISMLHTWICENRTLFE